MVMITISINSINTIWNHMNTINVVTIDGVVIVIGSMNMIVIGSIDMIVVLIRKW